MLHYQTILDESNGVPNVQCIRIQNINFNI